MASCAVTAGDRTHPEQWYQEQICKGATEYRLHDGTRVDCLTSTHAWEIDFADKWAECIGQALYYASQTGKQAGCALIIEKDEEYRFLARLYAAIQHLAVEVKVIRP